MKICPSQQDLERLLSAELPEEQIETTMSHVENCPTCQQQLEHMTEVEYGEILSGATSCSQPADPGPVREEPRSNDSGEGSNPPEQNETPLVNAPGILGYEILGELGLGGMGIVYEARQVNLNRRVALKMLRDQLNAAPEQLLRFQSEAETIARLHHPHIIEIYELGAQDHQPWFALKLMEGGNLSERIRKGLPSSRQAAALILKLAEAIHYAHEKGIVHRDLKPENVLFEMQGAFADQEDPVPRITDFGLARQLNSRVDLTRSGTMVGTPSYVAPEQAQARHHEIGPATDVHALGVMLYEMLTGSKPYWGATEIDVLTQVVGVEPRPPRQLNAQIPPDLETICLKCLQKHPRNRYGSAQELADDLRSLLQGKPITARPVGHIEQWWRWCRRQPRLASLTVGVLALLLGVLVLALIYADERSAHAEERTVAAANAQRLADEKKAEANKAIREKETAKKNAAAARRISEQLYAEKGARLADQGKLFEAMHWFVRPLREQHGPMEMERQHRLRFAAYWRFSQRPELRRIFIPENKAQAQQALFSPDGRHLMSTTSSLTVAVWNVVNGKPQRGLPEGHLLVDRFAITAEGIAATKKNVRGPSTTVQLWDVLKGVAVGPSLVSEGPVHAAALSRGGKRAALAGDDKTVHFWEARSGKPLGLMLRLPVVAELLVYSPDGEKLVSRCVDQTVQLWEVATGRLLHRFGKQSNRLLRPTFSPDSRYLLLATRRHAQVWSVTDGKAIGHALQHRDSVQAAAFSSDGRSIVTGSADCTAQLWDAATGQRIGPELRHESYVHDVAFSPDDARILTASQDRTARIWATASGHALTPFIQHQSAVRWIAFRPQSGDFLTVSDDHALRLWSPEPTPEMTHFLQTAQGHTLSARIRLKGHELVIASKSSTQIYRTTGTPIGLPFDHGIKTDNVVLSPEGRYLAILGLDHSLRVYDLTTRKLIGHPLPHQQRLGPCSFSRDGGTLAIVSGNMTIQVWNLKTWKLVGPPVKSPRIVQRAAVLSPDGRRIAVSSLDDQVRIWDVRNGQLVVGPLQHQEYVSSVAFSADGKRLVTASHDGTARTWNTSSGEPLGPPLLHSGEGGLAAFSPKGDRVVTAGMNGIVRAWDVLSGQPLTPPLPHENIAILHVQFTPDGNQVLTISKNQKVRLWNVSADHRPVKDLVRLTELLHGHRFDRFGTLIPLSPQEQSGTLHDLTTK